MPMRSLLRFTLGMALCAGLATALPLATGHAQQTPAAPQAEPNPAHLAAARQLVVVSGMSRSFAAAVPQIMARLDSTFTQTRPELGPDLKAVLTDLKPEFDKQTDRMIDTAAHIFAKLLTEDEIKQLDAFFESPVGKKYVEVQPAFFNEVVNAMQDWQQKMGEDMVTRVRAEMKKKGHDL